MSECHWDSVSKDEGRGAVFLALAREVLITYTASDQLNECQPKVTCWFGFSVKVTGPEK